MLPQVLIRPARPKYVAAVRDVNDEDEDPPVVDAIDNAKLSAARGPESGEFAPQFLTYFARVGREVRADELPVRMSSASIRES